MDRKKLIYIGLILILTVIVSITYFSYAFFTRKDEQSGKLNIVTGTLDYKIESNDLVNSSITLEANTSKLIEIEITSLNNIDSKYELYYQTTASDIEVGYDNDSDTPTGTILANSKKIVKIAIKNKSASSATINFRVEGGFINNSLVISNGISITKAVDTTCYVLLNHIWDFPYNGTNGTDGSIQDFNVSCAGNYKLEVWGAQGGGAQPGYGGYATGNIQLASGSHLYIVVGGNGISSTSSSNGGGYNGGGHGTNVNQPGSGGGGCTHIATTTGLLSTLSSTTNRAKVLIVAGGGGGSAPSASSVNGNGGSGGGYLGVTGGYYHNSNWSFYGTGGSQTSGGVCYLYGSNLADSGSYGSFGKGGNHGYESGNNVGGSGGGAGWYGGGGSSRGHGQAGGGSGYIGNTSLTSKSMYCYNCTQNLTNAATYTVSTTCLETTATANCAKRYNGYARITYLGE